MTGTNQSTPPSPADAPVPSAGNPDHDVQRSLRGEVLADLPTFDYWVTPETRLGSVVDELQRRPELPGVILRTDWEIAGVLPLAHDEETYSALSDRLVCVESHYEVENDLALLMSLAGYLPLGVENFWESSPTQRTQLSVALEEALTNGYFYGNLELDPRLKTQDPEQFYRLADERKAQPPYTDRRMSITARYTPDDVTFIIRDAGQGFDAARAVAREDAADLTDGAGGRGLRLMRTFLDRVQFNDRGNEVTLVKRRASENADR